MTVLGAFSPKPVNVKTRVGHKGGNNPQSEALREIIIKQMTDAANGAARNVQKAIGPSEIGEPCSRNVAYKVAGVEKQPSWNDPLPSIRGVAMHAWMEDNLPRSEWDLEHKLDCGSGVTGTSDAYHRPTRTVVDWKFLGATQHREYVGGYMSTKYEVQGHTYGVGWLNKGYPVERVALAIFGATKTLQDLYVWSEPFDPAYAQRALARLDVIKTYVATTNAGNYNRAPLQQVPATPGSGCFFCPYKGSSNQGLCSQSK